MTVIAGAIDPKGKIIMGGDSAGVSGYSLSVMFEPKVFRNGQFVIGFTSSFRMGDILRYCDLPVYNPNKTNNHRFMVESFVPVIRTLFKDGGFMKVEHSREEGGCFLVGFYGHLFQVTDDLQVGSSMDHIAAVGCGDQLAIGAMLAMLELKSSVNKRFIEIALSAAERGCAGVRGEFTIISLKNKNKK